LVEANSDRKATSTDLSVLADNFSMMGTMLIIEINTRLQLTQPIPNIVFVSYKTISPTLPFKGTKI